MKRSTIFGMILLGLLFVSCTMSKRTTYLVPLENLPEREPIDVAAYQEKYKGSDAVYLEIDYTLEHYGNKQSIWGIADWFFLDVVHQAWVVLNPENSSVSTYTTSEFPTRFYAKVVNPDGMTRNFSALDFEKDVDVAGDKLYRLIFPDLQVGAVIEIGYEKRYNLSLNSYPPIAHELLAQFDVPCEKLDVRYSYPSWWQIMVKNLGGGQELNYVMEEDIEAKKMALVYHAENIPALKDEPFSPYFKKVANYLQLQVVKMQMADRKLDMDKTWSEIADDIFKDVVKKSRAETIILPNHGSYYAKRKKVDIHEYAEEIVLDRESKLDKIRAIVGFVRENIESGRKPGNGDIAQMVDKKTGTHGDRTVLVQRLLSEVGIESRFVLIHSATDGVFDPEYATTYELTFPGLLVDEDSLNLVILPYLKNYPVTLIPTVVLGEGALVIDEVGGHGIVTLPDSSLCPTYAKELLEVTLDDSDVITAKVTRSFQGARAQYYRGLLEDLEGDKIKEALKDGFIELSDLNADCDTIVIHNQKEIDKELVLEYELKIRDLVSHVGNKILLRADALVSDFPGVASVPVSAERTQSIFSPYSADYSREIRVIYPETWGCGVEATADSLSNELGERKVTVATEPGLVVICQELGLKRALEPKEKIGELYALVGDKNKMMIPALSFELATGGE